MKKILLISIISSNLLLGSQSGDENFLEKIIHQTNDYRKSIHKKLINSSSNIDNFFFEQKNLDLEDYSQTYALFEISTYKNHNDSIEFDQKLNIKLKLPRLKENIKLMFESDEKRESLDFIEEQNKTKDYNLSLFYDNVLKNDLKLKTKIGLKLNDGLNPFIKSEISKVWEDIYGLDFIISEAIRLSKRKDFENTSYFQITKKIDEYLYLHSYNEHYWEEELRKDSQVYNTIYLNQKISDKKYLTYQIDANTNNIDSNLRLKRYSIKLKYKEYIRNWIYFEVIPENYYNYENNFEDSYAIRLNFGILFNKESYK